MAYNGLKIGKSLFSILKNNADINAANLLNNDPGLIQPAPMRLENYPVLGITYEIDSIDNIDIKKAYNKDIPVNLVSAKLEIFAEEYGTGAELARVTVEELTTLFVPLNYGGVVIQGINIDNVKQDFNPKTRRYVWRVLFDIRLYN